MKQVTNELTGEVYEFEDELPEDKANKLIELNKHKKEVARMFTDSVLDMYYQMQGLEERRKEFEFKLMEEMKKYGIKSIDNEYFNINYIAEHETTRVDTDKLKLAGIYEEFTKKSNTKESIRVKIK